VANNLSGRETDAMNVAPFLKNPSSVDSYRPTVTRGSAFLKVVKNTPSTLGGVVLAASGGNRRRLVKLSSPASGKRLLACPAC
jgi:hypothetical protein